METDLEKQNADLRRENSDLRGKFKAVKEAFEASIVIYGTWQFPLGDGVSCEVTIHGKAEKRHMDAFARLFQAVCDNYVEPATPVVHREEVPNANA